jgi:hypothetical protein
LALHLDCVAWLGAITIHLSSLSTAPSKYARFSNLTILGE